MHAARVKLPHAPVLRIDTPTATSHSMRTCRYAALVMPLNVLPALACIAAASTQHSAAAALAWIWAGLGAVMLMRVLTAWLPFHLRWGVFAQLPATSARL